MNEEKFVNAGEYFADLFSEIDPIDKICDDHLVYIANQLYKIRTAQGLSQKDAAERCGVTQAYVSKLESGDYNPSIAKLCVYLNKLSPDYRLEIGFRNDSKDTGELISRDCNTPASFAEYKMKNESKNGWERMPYSYEPNGLQSGDAEQYLRAALPC